ncbi:unnamed protein product [Larinioides sclopetarius]|uniref:Uncharacterized protein n=1 Tax=Larinioides sclopetarius TaxID=280406 RepID=A0AAV2ALN5_9ARAC
MFLTSDGCEFAYLLCRWYEEGPRPFRISWENRCVANRRSEKIKSRSCRFRMKWNSSVTTKLKVAYANLPPFVAVEETEKGDVLGGFIPQIMEMVARWMNLETLLGIIFEIIDCELPTTNRRGLNKDRMYLLEISSYMIRLTFIREPYDTYGNWENNTWNGMVGMLYRKEVDLILNPILPSDKFLEFLYYTNPITIEAYTILAGKKSEEVGLFLYFSVLDKSVWIGIIIALFVISVTSAALFRRARLPYSFQWLIPKENFILKKREQALSIFLPVLNMLWVFCIAFLVMNTFQSLLVSKLTLMKSSPVVDTIEDLAKSRGVICIAPREIQIEHILKESDLAINRLAWTKVDHETPQKQAFQRISRVETGELCIIHGHLIIKDRLSTYFKKKGTCNLHLSHKYFYPFSLMMAIHKRLPPAFAEIFNRGVTRLVDSDITGKWFEAALEVSSLCTSYSDNTLKPLGLEHILGVLVLWAAGLALSSVVLLFEIRLSKRRKAKATGDGGEI